MNRNKHFLSSNWLPTLSVGIGGFVGAILRYQLTRLMTPNSPAPLATWVINVSGSFILSWLYTVTIEKYPIHPYLRLGLGTGMLGAYTTYSTFAVDVWALLGTKHPLWLIAAYLIASVGGSLLAAILGYWIAHQQGVK